MFSALVSKTTKHNDNVNLNLDIPDLPDDVNYLQWQVPTANSFEWINYTNLMEAPTKKSNSAKTPTKKTSNLVGTDDEGFCSVKSSPLSIKLENNDLWDSILDYSISEYIDWDMRKEYFF